LKRCRIPVGVEDDLVGLFQIFLEKTSLVDLFPEKVFDSLTKPPLLISGPRYPVPTSHYLSKYSYVDSFNAAKKIIKFMGMRLSEKKFKDLNYNLEINTDHDKPNVEFTGPF